jgi:hypothetical protein
MRNIYLVGFFVEVLEVLLVPVANTAFSTGTRRVPPPLLVVVVDVDDAARCAVSLPRDG